MTEQVPNRATAIELARLFETPIRAMMGAPYRPTEAYLLPGIQPVVLMGRNVVGDAQTLDPIPTQYTPEVILDSGIVAGNVNIVALLPGVPAVNFYRIDGIQYTLFCPITAGARNAVITIITPYGVPIAGMPATTTDAFRSVPLVLAVTQGGSVFCNPNGQQITNTNGVIAVAAGTSPTPMTGNSGNFGIQAIVAGGLATDSHRLVLIGVRVA